ncbi:hypothetical protein V6N12_035902 [Hibiscus sabdariffa]|uniref:Uncharacterized protein n=1 Tax=Hibiscus sabdariffa TaxID=183260 RepID=A0ABR2ERK2_9ROSI
MTGDPLGVLEAWNLTSPFCNRTGVTRNVTKQRVMSIDLQNLGLEGTIAPHLGNLSFLNYLNLQNNTFFGSMPQEIGQIFRLRTLILGSNQIQGTILPEGFSRLPFFINIQIGLHNISGEIPPSLFKMLPQHSKMGFDASNW